jgi:hypothetical protein
VEPTAYSVRSYLASASGGGPPLALDGTDTMAQYLDPIIVSVAVMDRERLQRARVECLALVRPSRSRFCWLWFRNRLAYVSALGFYLLLVFGAIRFRLGDSGGLYAWSLLIAGLISLLITWFFISHTPLNAFLASWQSEEKVTKKELDKHLYTLRAIRRRHRELNMMSEH